jgi:Flp pilus assembly protein TadG
MRIGSRRIVLRRRDEAGAIAVVVAISAGVLFAMAAMSVDLGNAWARQRASQTQADLAALAGGQLLPKGDIANQNAIAGVVAEYLNDNKISDEQPTTTVSSLQDGNQANGEIAFPTDNQLRVFAPLSDVDFGFGGIVGPDRVQVAKDGTAEKRALTPRPDKILPMWLPATCVYGPVEGDTDPHPSPAASPYYDPSTDGFAENDKFLVESVTPTTAPFGTDPGSITVVLRNTSNSSAITGFLRIAFTFGPPTSWAAHTTVYAVPGGSQTIPKDGTLSVTVATSSELTNTVGDWEVWGLVSATNTAIPAPGVHTFSADVGPPTAAPGAEAQPKVYTVTGGGGEVGCDDAERGNFGQLDSPRTGMTALNKIYGYNIALGLDHKLKEFEPSVALAGGVDITTSPECFSDGNPAGAQIDNAVRNGNNCVYVQSGNDPSYLTDGLLAGVSGGPEGNQPGRLFSAPTSDLCTENGDKRAPEKADDGQFPWSDINRDTLSCFLKPGVELEDIAKDGADFDLVDQSIEESPRFFYVPIVYSLDRADKKYIAIKQFAPVFLTDETIDEEATEDNGVQMNAGGTQVFAVQVFAFNFNAIPVDPSGDDVEWFEGGRAVVRLVD